MDYGFTIFRIDGREGSVLAWRPAGNALPAGAIPLVMVGADGTRAAAHGYDEEGYEVAGETLPAVEAAARAELAAFYGGGEPAASCRIVDATNPQARVVASYLTPAAAERLAGGLRADNPERVYRIEEN